mmetsp:Transcript_143656/g.459666  ORF Transcript_143656/g.459666 Transcript_143656/m.459666 type:complete len:244 (-) Transcript_143656:115-846(-)
MKSSGQLGPVAQLKQPQSCVWPVLQGGPVHRIHQHRMPRGFVAGDVGGAAVEAGANLRTSLVRAVVLQQQRTSGDRLVDLVLVLLEDGSLQLGPQLLHRLPHGCRQGHLNSQGANEVSRASEASHLLGPRLGLQSAGPGQQGHAICSAVRRGRQERTARRGIVGRRPLLARICVVRQQRCQELRAARARRLVQGESTSSGKQAPCFEALGKPQHAQGHLGPLVVQRPVQQIAPSAGQPVAIHV